MKVGNVRVFLGQALMLFGIVTASYGLMLTTDSGRRHLALLLGIFAALEFYAAFTLLKKAR